MCPCDRIQAACASITVVSVAGTGWAPHAIVGGIHVACRKSESCSRFCDAAERQPLTRRPQVLVAIPPVAPIWLAEEDAWEQDILPLASHLLSINPWILYMCVAVLVFLTGRVSVSNVSLWAPSAV